jgi:glucoamylase
MPQLFPFASEKVSARVQLSMMTLNRRVGAFVLGGVLILPVGSWGLPTLNEWMSNQKTNAFTKLLRNISAPGTHKGAVIASPSTENPDYYFHWVRDAALVMDVLATRYKVASSTDKGELFKYLEDYADFSRKNQLAPALSGLGEPKFHVNGESYKGDWGRPQNDGPALRAITLIGWANELLDEGKEEYVLSHLYNPKSPSVIKVDLEFTSHHWREPSFDVWEEVKGQHFYTQMVQRRALIDGSKLAARLNDWGASGWYAQQAKNMEREIERHWSSSKGIIVVTLDREEGLQTKASQIDSAVILGILHGATHDGFFSVEDSRVQSTVRKQEEVFGSLYLINKSGPAGVAIGRYPEDRYDGYSTNGLGNPWFLLTHAFGEYYYRLANHHHSKGDGQAAERFRKKGDAFLERTKYHADGDANFAEQFNRYSGYMQGARDLTWSYASILTALAHR